MSLFYIQTCGFKNADQYYSRKSFVYVKLEGTYSVRSFSSPSKSLTVMLYEYLFCIKS